MTGQNADRFVEIYTDGACSGNPGPGGWGALLSYDGHRKELHGGSAEATTNNRMELMGAIQALESLTRPSAVRLHTDSSYLRNGITSWLPGWKRNGWMTAGKKPVKNADLWRRLDAAAARHQVSWLWVRGHAGDPGNERADALANLGMREARGGGGPSGSAGSGSSATRSGSAGSGSSGERSGSATRSANAGRGAGRGGGGQRKARPGEATARPGRA